MTSTPDRPAVSAPSSATPPVAGRGWRIPWYGVALVLLMAAAAGLRFYRIDRPTLWYDEVATYSRVTGTIHDLLGILSNEGFIPLHYIAYWALGKMVTLTPFWMRFIPAVSGVISVPAIYFLARGFFGRRVALLSATIAACSAWSLAYSRDAKMYMDTWAFLAIALACLVNWLKWRPNTGARWTLLTPTLLWIGWTLAGTVAAWLHASSLAILALTPLALLSHLRYRWWSRLPMYLFALALIVAGPVYWYTSLNRYLDLSGIVSKEVIPSDIPEPLETKDPAWKKSGLDWIERFNQGVPPWSLTLNSASCMMFGGQWPRQAVDPGDFPGPIPAWYSTSILIAMSSLLIALALAVLPWPARWRGTDAALIQRAGAPPPARGQPPAWWLCVIVLGSWIVVPIYGYYCRSTVGFVSPLELPFAAWRWMGWHGLFLLACAPLVAVGIDKAPRLKWPVLVIAAGSLGVTLYLAMTASPQTWLVNWGQLLAQPIVAWSLLLPAGALMWTGAGPTWKTRLLRLVQAVAAGAVIWLLCLGIYLVFAGIYEKSLVGGKPVNWHSIWMPRYQGVIWPVLVVAMSALILRLPSWPLRALVIVALLGANLTQSVARVEADTEAPFDRIAQDVWASRYEEQKQVTHFEPQLEERETQRWFHSWRAWYYVQLAGNITYPTPRFRRGEIRTVARITYNRTYRGIAGELRRKTNVPTLVIWRSYGQPADPAIISAKTDGLLKALGPRWKLTSDQWTPTRQFWTWRAGDWYRRTQYDRVDPPASQPNRP